MERYIQELNGLLEEERAKNAAMEAAMAASGVFPVSPSKIVAERLTASPVRQGDKLSSMFSSDKTPPSPTRPASNPFRDISSQRPNSLDLEKSRTSEETRVVHSTSPLRRPTSFISSAFNVLSTRKAQKPFSTVLESPVSTATPPSAKLSLPQGLAEAVTLSRVKSRSDPAIVKIPGLSISVPVSPRRFRVPIEPWGASHPMSLTPTPKRLGDMGLSARIYDRVVGAVAVHDTSSPLFDEDMEIDSLQRMEKNKATDLRLRTSPVTSPKMPKIHSPFDNDSPLSIRIPSPPLQRSNRSSPASSVIAETASQSWRTAKGSVTMSPTAFASPPLPFPHHHHHHGDDDDEDEFFSTRGSSLMSPSSSASGTLRRHLDEDEEARDDEASDVLRRFNLYDLSTARSVPLSVELASAMGRSSLAWSDHTTARLDDGERSLREEEMDEKERGFGRDEEGPSGLMDRWLGLFARFVGQPALERVKA
ncbi:hypothetical protein BC829DRAFT_410373 [Chytridium lagenaria]|nr:hypothetical protein BC829DRAFT_410373 [Chytridium lagenaria]